MRFPRLAVVAVLTVTLCAAAPGAAYADDLETCTTDGIEDVLTPTADVRADAVHPAAVLTFPAGTVTVRCVDDTGAEVVNESHDVPADTVVFDFTAPTVTSERTTAAASSRKTSSIVRQVSCYPVESTPAAYGGRGIGEPLVCSASVAAMFLGCPSRYACYWAGASVRYGFGGVTGGYNRHGGFAHTSAWGSTSSPYTCSHAASPGECHFSGIAAALTLPPPAGAYCRAAYAFDADAPVVLGQPLPYSAVTSATVSLCV